MAQSINLLQGPEPVETTDLHFKLYSKLKVFESSSKLKSNNCSLLAVSQYYGLIFVGNLNGFSVIQTKAIKSTTNCNEYPKKVVALGMKPTHISVDFTQKLLGVVCCPKPDGLLYLYDIASFANKVVTPLKVIRLGNVAQSSNTQVLDLMWQPNTDGILMICMSDGSVLSLNPSSKESSAHTLPPATQAVCFCWSPKGKQIVIGCAIGTLSQYKPDLKLVKTLAAPPLFNGAVTVVSVLWISNYQFAVAYNERNNSALFPVITIVNAAKNEPVNVINYDDIPYSSTFSRQHQIYMFHQSMWNLIFISSANSIEIAVLHSKDSSSWEQWLLGDASRAELPLNTSRQETFPLGLAFDFTSEESIPWGESSLPSMPRLLLLSDEGVLCIFNVVNLTPNAPELCVPAKEQLPDFPLTKAVASPASSAGPSVAPPVSESQKPSQAVHSFSGQPVFGSAKPTYTFGLNTSIDGSSSESQFNTTPQVTITLPEKSVFSGAKQVQPQLQLQSQQSMLLQKPQQQPTNTPARNLPSVAPPKYFTYVSQYSTVNPLTYTIQTSQVNFTYAPKPPATQPHIVFTTGNALKPKADTAQANIFKNQSLPQVDVFAGKPNVLQSTPVKLSKSTVKPVGKPTIGKQEQAEFKSEDSSTKANGSSGSSSPALPELAVVDDSVYWNALQDEIDHFNSELQMLSSKVKNLDIQVGTTEDEAVLHETIEHLNDFSKEVKEITLDQNNEIHSVVMDLMESFAWLEDAKSRSIQSKNPSFIELKRSEELDPISTKYMNEILHLKYYIENQLKQLTSHLEKKWMDYQNNYRVEIKNQMTVPPLEEVYKTMHYQLKILSKHRSLVEELKSKMIAKKRKDTCLKSFVGNSSPSLSPLHGSNRISELSKLADNLLQLKIDKEENFSRVGNREFIKAQLKTISERTKKLTLDKQAALRDVLSERDMVKIRPIKTSFENSSFLRSLALNSSACKVSPSETHSAVKVSEKRNEKIASPTKLKSIVLSKPETDVKPKPEPEKTEAQEMSPLKTQDPPKGVILFGNKTPPQNQVTTGQTSSAKVEEKSPLASLSGIVSSIEKETDVKPKSTDFAFGFPSSFKLNNTETIKESFVFGSTEKQFQKKPEETKAPQTFTFGLSKPPDSIFGKTMETSNFNIKSSFNVVASETNTTTKQESPKTGIAVVPFSTATPATTFSPFTFTFTSPTFASSTGLPKVNVSFGKEQVLETATTTSATPQTTNASGNLLSTSFSQSSSTPLVGSSPFTFTSAKTTSSCDTPTSSTQLTSSVFSHPIEKKGVVVTEVSVIKSNLETETEEVDVLSVEDFEKPSVFTNSSVSLKATPNIISATSPIVSTVETTSTTTISSATAVQGVTTSQSSPDTSASTFTKPAVATSGETPSISASPVFDSTATSIATSSVLTFSTSSPLVFGQTTPASTNFFGQPPSTTSVTVSSTTPTPRGETTTTNIFGGTLTTKPVFGQASTASTSTSGTILSNSTSAIVTTSSDVVATAATGSSSVFTESVAQTTNIFGQLLSDSNRSENLFSTSSTTATSTPNIFSTPKNVFGGATTTTASAFGETNSIFLQNNSVFQQLGSPSNTFENTPNSMVFGEQNVCSPFGGSISATSNQSTFESGGFESKSIFGQSLFGSNTNNTFVFGGSSGLSIFGGSSSSSGNVFQPTTTTTFGCTTPGPFSSSQGSVAETGFGAANTFQKPLSGFGSPPVFGGRPSATPTFGSSGASTFGSSTAPAFGGSATFGSQTFGIRPRGFDSSQGNFAQPQGHSTTFENLANQNTVGFGNLALQSQGQTGFAGYSSTTPFKNKPAFEGSSFSSWRSK